MSNEEQDTTPFDREATSTALQIAKQLSPEQQHVCEDILRDEFSPDAVARLGQALHGCLYTTTALRMLADHQRRQLDDNEGADILEAMSRLFARFEAVQV